jgi:uncharacterized protein YbaP (TraB family)
MTTAPGPAQFLSAGLMHLRIIVSTILIALLGCAQFAVAAKPISLWMIESDQAKVYLLGSIHVMRPNMYPLSPPINAAFADSDVAVFEVDMKTASGLAASRFMQEKGLYAGHETIFTELSDQTLELLQDYFISQGIDIAQFERFRSWMLAVNIGLIELSKLGLDPAMGIDLHYQTKAKQAGKTILALETFEEQIELLSGDTPAVQELGLKLSLQHLDETPEFIEMLIGGWARGDADGMYHAAAADHERHPELKAQFERLLDRRNEKMAEKIAAYLKTEQTYFVVVGAMHMGGDKGLLRLLGEAQEIQQIRYSPE